MAFDRHMNIVLGDTEEYRKIKSKKGQGISEEKEEKRALGLIVVRGDSVVSMTIHGPPPPEEDEKITPGGPGVGKAAGRGLPMAGAPMGLGGPVRGVGGPASSIMQPPPMHGEQYQSINRIFIFKCFLKLPPKWEPNNIPAGRPCLCLACPQEVCHDHQE